MKFRFWRKPAPVRDDGWLELCTVTVMNRGAKGFHTDVCAEEMAQAARTAKANGASRHEIFQAIEAAYYRNFLYSTPHEHPCDEWKWHDIMKAAA